MAYTLLREYGTPTRTGGRQEQGAAGPVCGAQCEPLLPRLRALVLRAGALLVRSPVQRMERNTRQAASSFEASGTLLCQIIHCSALRMGGPLHRVLLLLLLLVRDPVGGAVGAPRAIMQYYASYSKC